MNEKDDKIKVTIDIELEEIISDYLRMVQDDINSLLKAVNEKNYNTLKKIGHNLKGSGCGYGFDQITEIGSEIERLASEGQGEEIGALIARLSGYLENIEIEYANMD